MRFATQTSGKCKITWKQTSTNSAAGLTAANIVGDAGQNAVGVRITLETNSIRYTLDGEHDPTGSGGANFGHVMAKDTILILDDPGQIQNFKFISHTASSHGIIHVSSFFAKL